MKGCISPALWWAVMGWLVNDQTRPDMGGSHRQEACTSHLLHLASKWFTISLYFWKLWGFFDLFSKHRRALIKDQIWVAHLVHLASNHYSDFLFLVGSESYSQNIGEEVLFDTSDPIPLKKSQVGQNWIWNYSWWPIS